MAEPFLGSIILVGFNFAPRGYAFCNGQILAISQNAALFSLLGTTYGGNGTSTFALPNLQSRVPIHAGQGPGLSNYVLGQEAGVETTTLTISNLPQHQHQLNASSAEGTTRSPATAVPAGGGSYAASANTQMSATGFAGSSVPFSTVQPYLALNYIIALEGIYPSRN